MDGIDFMKELTQELDLIGMEGFALVVGWCPKCSTAWSRNPELHTNRCPRCEHVLADMFDEWIGPLKPLTEDDIREENLPELTEKELKIIREMGPPATWMKGLCPHGGL